MIKIAKEYGVDAIHPGYGFLAESWRFAELCEKNGIKFIGPKADTLKKFEDKVEAKMIAERLGAPTLSASGEIKDEEELWKKFNEMEAPVILKARRGGGGMGIRVLDSNITREGLSKVVEGIQKQMSIGFSDAEFFLERYLPEARHIEFQVLGDGTDAVHLGERDCTIQRRFQKLLEETPSPYINDEQRKKMGDWAVRICKALEYEGSATVEFLVDKAGDFYFMEINPRIQVEHTITEAVTGIDIVEQQIRISRGEKLSFVQEDIKNTGCAIEVRINAEDPQKNFSPNPGRINKYISCGGQGVCVHSFLHDGQEIFPFFDSLVAKVVVYSKDRDSAIIKLKGALDEIVIEGVPTTIPFFSALLEDKDFLKGDYHTNFVEKSEILKRVKGCPPCFGQKEGLDESVVAEIVCQAHDELKKGGKQFVSKWVMTGRLKMMN